MGFTIPSIWEGFAFFQLGKHSIVKMKIESLDTRKVEYELRNFDKPWLECIGINLDKREVLLLLPTYCQVYAHFNREQIP